MSNLIVTLQLTLLTKPPQDAFTCSQKGRYS